MFKRLLSSLTGGGVSVETVLDSPTTYPGGSVAGSIRLTGGDQPVDIERVVVALATRVEVESGDSEWSQAVEFGHVQVTGPMRLDPGGGPPLRFVLPVPWETPLTAVAGQQLRRPTVGLRTDVEIARAVDQGDLDPVIVAALPAQERVLDALFRLGFRFKGADVERGRRPGSLLPFYQEFEFFPAPRYARGINELEVTFVPGPQRLRVLLEADRRGGFFTEGYDAHAGFDVDYATADRTDFAAVLDSHLQALGRRRGLFF